MPMTPNSSAINQAIAHMTSANDVRWVNIAEDLGHCQRTPWCQVGAYRPRAWRISPEIPATGSCASDQVND